MIEDMKKELLDIADPVLAKNYSRFFKTGKGDYGEGDKFLGMRVPTLRKVCKKYNNMDLNEVEELLHGEFHEFRQGALFILIHQYEKNPKKIVEIYLRNTKYINNWDLVDISAHKIVGRYLENKDRAILYKLANSKDLWEKRISIISCFWFIKDKDFKDAINISEILLHDSHDLIHKAVGWVLREIGKKDQEVEEEFLKKYHQEMPRTMLRYSIEKFSDEKRKFYMSKVNK
ncbi:DNA alkylation repair protein [archaeon]|jgi:3-methyladenine DNA glycosylase AlkD|nr:DNA alkylation repair protein [archaeon]